MTTLLNGNVNIQQGPHESNVFSVPGGIKQPNVPLKLQVSLGAEQFPDGTSIVSIFISTDGGLSFRSASMTVNMPTTFRGPPPHFWVLSLQLGANDVPTHMKYSTNAPSAFTTTVKIDAL
jgi:hypothetical protein